MTDRLTIALAIVFAVLAVALVLLAASQAA
jgi:preprotein translocase subunit SecG